MEYLDYSDRQERHTAHLPHAVSFGRFCSFSRPFIEQTRTAPWTSSLIFATLF
jgi:hypothetical protein